MGERRCQGVVTLIHCYLMQSGNVQEGAKLSRSSPAGLMEGTWLGSFEAHPEIWLKRNGGNQIMGTFFFENALVYKQVFAPMLSIDTKAIVLGK